MKQNPWEGKSDNPNAKEILSANPDFKKKATEISATLGYNKKFYALGLTDINQEGEYKGHAKSSNIGYWEDSGRSREIGII